jgi:hypothetical protein
MCRCNAARLRQTRDRQQGKEELCRTMTSSCAACRTTVCREVTRSTGEAAVQRLRADSYGSSIGTSEAIKEKLRSEGGGRGRSNAARVRRAAQDRLRW